LINRTEANGLLRMIRLIIMRHILRHGNGRSKAELNKSAK
jgi:hypothetical protein